MENLNICFGGFYESLHSMNIDSMIDSYYDEESYYDISIDYGVIQKEYSKRYIDFLNEFLKDEFELNVNIVFTGINSPREYSFTTDKIVVNISDEDISTIINHFKDDKECIAFIDEASSTKEGFISFYDGYNEVIKENDVHIEYIFKYIDSLNDDDFSQWYDLNCMYELLHGIEFEIKE